MDFYKDSNFSQHCITNLVFSYKDLIELLGSIILKYKACQLLNSNYDLYEIYLEVKVSI